MQQYWKCNKLGYIAVKSCQPKSAIAKRNVLKKKKQSTFEGQRNTPSDNPMKMGLFTIKAINTMKQY